MKYTHEHTNRLYAVQLSNSCWFSLSVVLCLLYFYHSLFGISLELHTELCFVGEKATEKKHTNTHNIETMKEWAQNLRPRKKNYLKSFIWIETRTRRCSVETMMQRRWKILYVKYLKNTEQAENWYLFSGLLRQRDKEWKIGKDLGKKIRKREWVTYEADNWNKLKYEKFSVKDKLKDTHTQSQNGIIETNSLHLVHNLFVLDRSDGTIEPNWPSRCSATRMQMATIARHRCHIKQRHIQCEAHASM